MSSDFPKTLVSIVNWNGYQNTIRCLESLTHLNYADVRIVVIDNASCDDSVQHISQRFPDIEIISAPTNVGFAGGHALSVDQTLNDPTIELIWLLNNDTVVNENTLIALIQAYQTYGNNLYGSVPLSYPDGRIIEALMGYALDANGQPDYDIDLTKFVNQDYQTTFKDKQPRFVTDIHGSSFLVPIDVIKQYGFMDQSYFLYAEERDYCIKLKKHGIKCVLAPASTMMHIHGASLNKSESLSWVSTYYGTRNYLVYVRRYSKLTTYLWVVLASWLALLKDLVKLITTRHTVSQTAFLKKELFYRGLGICHAIIGHLGKTLAPEDFYNCQAMENFVDN